ncbi:hypothetical protein DEJ53_10860 [Weissella confusa]|nr:hypothetical protein DEJ53_10860 [Weissella confusa]
MNVGLKSKCNIGSMVTNASEGREAYWFIGADVKIMDRLFWHREVPHSENFSKPGFQLKTA